jgi:hypothetical protein
VTALLPRLAAELKVLSIGTTQGQTTLATQAWEELPPNWGFNPTILFDADVGLPAILQNHLSNLQLVGTEQQLEDSSGDLLYKLKADVAGTAVYEMSGTMIGPNDVTAELWIDPETFDLVRILVTEPGPDSDEPTVWQVDFSQFDQTVTIEPPLP